MVRSIYFSAALFVFISGCSTFEMVENEDYHQPTDTIDKIDFNKYNSVVQLIYTTTIKTANSNERPVMDNDTFIDITQSIRR